MAFNLGTASARLTLDISDLAGKSAQAQGILTGLDGAAGKASGGMSSLTKGFLNFGTAAIPAMMLGVREAVNLEQAIANVNAALGGVDAGVLDSLSASFREIGVESQFSATEVAAIGEGLAKAGFTVEEMLNGATEAVVNLAQATGDGLDPAMTAVIATMNTWNETAAKSGQAVTDASRVADVFTVAANESSAGIADINAGMRALGPVAVALGIPFEDAAAAIALFTNNGLKGADAGVSLARGFQNLADPTSEAAQWMDKLGIAAFDMNGNFIGMPALFDQLQTGMADLDDQTKLTALSTIFGAEAMDVMGLAILNGADPLQALIDLMGESGAAAEQSAMRMDTLGAQWGTLKEGIATLLGSLVSGLIPGLRLLVDTANAVVDVFMRIPGPIKTVIGAVAGLAAGIAAAVRAIQGFRLLNSLFAGAGAGSGALGLGSLAVPLLALAAAVGVAYVAIKSNLFGIGDAIRQFVDSWNAIGSLTNNPISRFLSAFGAALNQLDIGFMHRVAEGVFALSDAFTAFFDGFGGPGGGGKLKTDIDVTGDDKVIEWVTNPETGEIDYKVRIKNPDGSFKEFGTVMESYTDENDPNIAHIKIKTEDGEYWTTVEKDTGVVGEGTIEVSVDKKSARETRSTLDKIQDGLDGMTASLEKSDYPWLAQFPRAASKAIDSIRTFTEGFRMAREAGADPLEASLRALGMTIPGLSDLTARLEMGWRDMKDTFQQFREWGIGPVGSALLALGTIIPALMPAMQGLQRVTENLGDAFQAAIRGDWAGAFDGLAQAARSAWVVVREIAGGIGGMVANLWDWTINVGVPAVTGWIADNAGDIGSAILSAAGWVLDNIIVPLGQIILNIGGWLVQAAQSAWEAIKNWVMGHGAGVTGGGTGLGLAAGGEGIGVGTVLLTIGGWIVNAVQSAWDAIRDFVLGHSDAGGSTDYVGHPLAGTGAGDIPIGRIRVSILGWDVNVNGDALATAIQDAVRAWELAAAVDAKITKWKAILAEPSEVDSSAVDDGHWWEQKVDIPLTIDTALTLGEVQVADPDSVFNKAGNAITVALGTKRMLEGGPVNWKILLGAPEIGGFGLMPTLLWIDANITLPIAEKLSTIGETIGAVKIALPGITWPSLEWALDSIPIVKDIKAAVEAIRDFIEDPWGGSISVSAPDIDWPDMPEPPQWMKNVQAGRLPWDDGGGGDGAFADLGAQLGSMVQTLGARLADAMARLGTSMSPSGGFGGPKTGVLMQWAQGIDVESVAATIAGKARAALDSVKGTISTAAAGWGTAIQTGTANLGTSVAAAMLGAQLAVQMSMTTIGTSIGTQAATWATNLQTGLTTMTTATTTAMLGVQMAVSLSMLGIGTTIGTQATAWAPALSTGLLTMTTAAVTAMATVGTAVTAGMQIASVAVTAGTSGMSAAMSAGLSVISAQTASAFATIAAVVQGGMAIASAAVQSGRAAMTAAMQAAGAAMTGAATTAAATTASVIAAGMVAATGAVSANASQWAGIIAAAGGAMAAAGYSAGLNAGLGVAAGLYAALGAVQSAAAQIMYTVAGAMAAAAMIHSPSRLTAQIGYQLGMGVVSGMESTYGAVSGAAAGMMGAATPYLPATPAGALGGGGTVVNNGPQTLNATINTQSVLTDDEVRRLTWQIAKAQRDAVDIEFTGQGVTT